MIHPDVNTQYYSTLPKLLIKSSFSFYVKRELARELYDVYMLLHGLLVFSKGDSLTSM